MNWYLEDIKRHKLEREELERLADTEHWLTPLKWRMDGELRLNWDADLSTPAGNRPITLRYPNHFPYSPPLVLPRGDTTRWSMHQYGSGGELCLEYGPDNWHPDITGAEMIASAYRLLQSEEPVLGVSGNVASRHETTLGQDLRAVFSRFLITRNLAQELQKLPESTVVTAIAKYLYSGNTLVRIIASIDGSNGRIWKEDLPNVDKFGSEEPIVLFRWPNAEPLPPTTNLADFSAEVAKYNLIIPDVTCVVLICKENILPYFLHQESNSVLEITLIPPQSLEQRLANDHSILLERSVAIVGCGSLGSKIAVSLARSGVGTFLLVDDDLFLPDNLIRHDLDWRDAGMHKADSVARRIKLVNAGAKCKIRKHKLGGQEASEALEGLIESLGKCDLIIDATAESTVFNYACSAVAVFKKPMIWAEIFGGGIGGLIARHRPSCEPDPASMRRSIENWCADQGKRIPRPVHPYGGDIAASIADDGDVTVIAGHATRMAIDLLIFRDPSIFPHSVYMIGLSEGWIFDQPFATYPINVGHPVSVDPSASLEPKEALAELHHVIRLLEEYKNAADSSR